MIKQTQLRFKLGVTEDEITSRAGLSVYSEFLRGFGVKELIDRHMPLPGSKRGYRAWNYIEPIMLMLYGGGRHIEDLREIVADRALRRLVGMEGLPSGDFGANSFWFSIGVLVYNTFILQKGLLLPEEFRTKTIQTLRWSLVGIAGKVKTWQKAFTSACNDRG